jgi:hypothetical protein
MKTQIVSQEAGHSPFAPTQGHLHGEAPKITPHAIEENIIAEHFFTAAQGARMAQMDVIAQTNVEAVAVEAIQQIGNIPEPLHLLTFCVLTLKNGFTVVGKSACASPTNFNQQVGCDVARGDAIRQIWSLMGYELRTRLSQIDAIGDAELGEALTRMTAWRLGNLDAFRPEDSEIILRHMQTKANSEVS